MTTTSIAASAITVTFWTFEISDSIQCIFEWVFVLVGIRLSSLTCRTYALPAGTGSACRDKTLRARDTLVLQDLDSHAPVLGLAFFRRIGRDLLAGAHSAWS